MTVPERLAVRPVVEVTNGVDKTLQVAPSAHPPRALVWGAVAALAGLAALWLAVRPSSPQGAAAVVDLLVLPAVLFAEARLLAGRPTISAGGFSILFGLGAVLATVVALVLGWLAEQLLDASAAGAFGSVVDVAAPALPVVVVTVLLLRASRRPSPADLGLAGMASGLGFLVIQSSLVTAAAHRFPDHVSPLVAGWQRIPAAPGVEPTWFVGPGVATALIGLAIWASVHWSSKPWRLAPPLLALCLVGLDRAVFNRQLRGSVAGEVPSPSTVIDIVQPLTFSGRIELLLLVLGLLLGGRIALLKRITSGSAPPPGPAATSLPETEKSDSESGGGRPGEHTPVTAALVAAVALGSGALFVALARAGHLGFLLDRPVALAVSVAGLFYAVLRLAALRPTVKADAQAGLGDEAGAEGEQPNVIDLDEEAAPPIVERRSALHVAEAEGVGEQPTDEGRQLLCVSAVAASGLGVILSLFLSPSTPRPVHGSLMVQAIEGWAASAGHLGLLLGIAGFAAPPGPIRPISPGGWSDILPWRLRQSGWWRGLAPRSFRVGWLGFWRLEAGGGSGRSGRSSGRLPWRRAGWRPALPDEPEAHPPVITIGIEPVEDRARSREEFVGATVQEAMQTALRHLAVGLSGTSLQLVDEGLQPKQGKPGSGRPARVRVVSGRDEAGPLRPPDRSSIARTTPLAVVVEVVDVASAKVPARDTVDVVSAPESDAPRTIEVTLTNPVRTSEHRILTCYREERSPGRARYRSNPYAVDTGEDPTWFPATGPLAKGLRIREGEQLQAQHGGETATVAVYDGWARQVVAVNRALFDVTGAHHINALAAWDPPAVTLTDGPIEQRRSALVAVDEGRQLLSSTAPDDEKAFLSTALLHRTLLLDPHGRDMTTAASRALEEHRTAVRADPARDTAETSYRRFLEATEVGRLWATGASSTEAIGENRGLDPSRPSGEEVVWKR